VGPEILFLLWPVPVLCLAFLIFRLPRRWRFAGVVTVAAALTAAWFLLPMPDRLLAIGFFIVAATAVYLFVVFVDRMNPPP
jgi:hypothetical protein